MLTVGGIGPATIAPRSSRGGAQARVAVDTPSIEARVSINGVEAATGPLWTWLLAAADWLTPIRLEWIAVLGGILLTVLGVTFKIAPTSFIDRPSASSFRICAASRLSVFCCRT